MTVKIITLTPTITAGAYSAGDTVGGKLTLTSALGASNKGKIIGAVLTDLGKQSAAMSLVFYAANPSLTLAADGDALDVDDADLVRIIGGFSIAALDYIAFADSSAAVKSSLSVPLEGSAQTIYAHMMTTGTPTYTSTSDLTLKLYIEV
jgi:hypothetical protein